MTFEQIGTAFLRILETSVLTLELFFFTLLFALPLGMLLALGRMSRVKPLSWLIQGYLLIMRGTPLLLQLTFFWYLIPLPLTRLQSAIMTFSLNYAAYFAEIYRSGIQSIPAGQKEAAGVLGFSGTQTFFRITLPQVIKRILPPMGNEFMTLVKDTSLAQVMGIVEISAIAGKLRVAYVSFIPMVIAGAFYLVMNAAVTRAFNRAERRLSYYR